MNTLSRRSTILTVTTLVSVLCLLALLSLLTFNLSSFFSPRRDISWLDYDHDAESLAEATRVPNIISCQTNTQPAHLHTFDDNGEVIVCTDAPRHPVLDILEHTCNEWDALLYTHNGDNAIAMLQYQYRHTEITRHLSKRRSPGFSHLHIFNPISPSLLEPRQRETELLTDTFTLILRAGVPHITYGNLTAAVSEIHRARRVEYLLFAIQPFINTLPDLRATFSLLSHPRHALSFQSSDTLAALAADQPLPNSPVKFLSQADPSGTDASSGRSIHAVDLLLLEGDMNKQARWNWENACRGKSDYVAYEEEGQKSDLSPPIRFVAYPKVRGNPCVHRALMELHPYYKTTDLVYHKRLSPVISDTTAPWASDILFPPLDLFAPQHVENNMPSLPWDNKTSGLFWRGPIDGLPTSHPAQRLKHLFAKPVEHEIILPTDNEGFLIDRKRLADVLVSDVQEGSEDEARQAEVEWKFLADLDDGARMQEKMASGGLVFRPLLLGDWVSERSIPWVHYVPVQPDLSDLPSLVTFFERHDALARRIANSGQAWAREQLNQVRARESVKEILEGFAGLGLGLPAQ